MPNFNLIVVGNKIPIEEQMAPFYLNKQVNEYKKFMSPSDVCEMYNYLTSEGVVLMGHLPLKEFIPPSKNDINYRRYMKILEILEPHIRRYTEANGGIENGDLYYKSTRNPEGKWSSYEIGGWWNQFFMLKSGGTAVPQATIGEINRDEMVRTKDVQAESIITEFNERIKALDSLPDVMKNLYTATLRESYSFKANENIHEYKSRISRRHPFHAFAFLKSGRWYQRSIMNKISVDYDLYGEDEWSGLVRNLIDIEPDSTTLTVLECKSN